MSDETTHQPTSANAAWSRFRRWPVWGQALVWLLLWPVPLVLLALAKPRGTRTGWWALAVAGLFLWVMIPVTAAQSPKTVNTTAVTTLTTAPGSTAAASTNGGASAATTDPDELSDPSAAGATPPPAASSAPAAAGGACRSGNPLTNVYHPYRLEVVKPCITVTGTVVAVRFETDGDIHVNVTLDSQYSALINSRNVSGEGGALVTEVVPADEPGCTPGQPPRAPTGSYNYGICTGADESPPAVGAHVSVTGPYVLDTDHGWMEIHPVWSYGSGTSSGAATTVAPSQPPTTSPSPTSPPPASGTTITSGPGTVNPGQYASLTARTSPNSQCNLSVTLPSGRQSASSGLGPGTADGSGNVTWSWKIGTTTSPGTATANVSCATGSASTTFQIT